MNYGVPKNATKEIFRHEFFLRLELDLPTIIAFKLKLQFLGRSKNNWSCKWGMVFRWVFRIKLNNEWLDIKKHACTLEYHTICRIIVLVPFYKIVWHISNKTFLNVSEEKVNKMTKRCEFRSWSKLLIMSKFPYFDRSLNNNLYQWLKI